MFVKTVVSFAVEMELAFLFCFVATDLRTVPVMAAMRLDVVSIFMISIFHTIYTFIENAIK